LATENDCKNKSLGKLPPPPPSSSSWKMSPYFHNHPITFSKYKKQQLGLNFQQDGHSAVPILSLTLLINKLERLFLTSFYMESNLGNPGKLSKKPLS
jgi:hypothetical protein